MQEMHRLTNTIGQLVCIRQWTIWHIMPWHTDRRPLKFQRVLLTAAFTVSHTLTRPEALKYINTSTIMALHTTSMLLSAVITVYCSVCCTNSPLFVWRSSLVARFMQGCELMTSGSGSGQFQQIEEHPQ